MEYNMKNIFPQKSYAEYGRRKTSGKTYLNKFEHISGSVVWSFMLFVLIVCHVEGYRNILKLSFRPLAFTSY